jgi:hypothetical protein
MQMSDGVVDEREGVMSGRRVRQESSYLLDEIRAIRLGRAKAIDEAEAAARAKAIDEAEAAARAKAIDEAEAAARAKAIDEWEQRNDARKELRVLLADRLHDRRAALTAVEAIARAAIRWLTR